MTFEVGSVYTLSATQEVGGDFVLSDGEEIIVLPKEEVKGHIKPGDEIPVFIYQNKKNEMIATMHVPHVTSDTYDWAEVVDGVRGLGVFVTIGSKQDVLVSSDYLPLLEKVWPKKGDELFVTLETDKKGRLLARPATETVVEDSFKKAPPELKGSAIEGRVYRSTKVGSFIITESGYRGFIHFTERKVEPRLGEWVEGRIIDVKEDGSINVTLRPVKEAVLSDDAEDIFNYLIRTGGEMPFTDKSDPEKIRETFNISKASFKRGIGRLMKEGKVTQKDGVTKVVTEEKGDE
ncbi:CvfB family protein [Alteribacter aurantiacus]|uniref:CvfB family protein n=1 Tax=Alteribacter aurantiacus TaxID=254410 RepID=UPI00042119EF|nr:S1-like domain-containing RNA-binding protein [Alteribacter aurantiacus]